MKPKWLLEFLKICGLLNFRTSLAREQRNRATRVAATVELVEACVAAVL